MRPFVFLIVVIFSCDVAPAEGRVVRTSADWDRVDAVAQQIDAQFDKLWQTEGIVPAPAADDAAILRRLWLDLAGRIPRTSDVRDFVDDSQADKRRRLIDQLIESPLFVVHQTNVWRRMLLPEADADREQQLDTAGFEAWFRDRLRERRNYAEIVRELLTFQDTGQSNMNAQRVDVEGPVSRIPTPVAFFQAKKRMPENMAAAVSRLFLGVRLECAQCHDHPFNGWKRERFWELAAFFNEAQAPNMTADGTAPRVATVAKHLKGTAPTIQIPETKTVVTAAFLDGSQPDFSEKEASLSELERMPRAKLAQWIISAQNPFFAKAAVNRLWSAYFGVGLVEPADDFSVNNPASHPAVLDLLAETFVRENYDVRFMTRVILSTRAYQMTSRRTDPSQDHPRSYARMTIRGLTPAQLFDSLAQSIGYQQPFDPDRNPDEVDPVRREFLETFVNTDDSSVDRPTSLLHVLTLMNGPPLNGNAGLPTQPGMAAPRTRLIIRTADAVIDAPFLSDAERIEALFLATLSRAPRTEESERSLKHLKAASTGNPQRPLDDLLWALLNSAEFMTNH